MQRFLEFIKVWKAYWKYHANAYPYEGIGLFHQGVESLLEIS